MTGFFFPQKIIKEFSLFIQLSNILQTAAISWKIPYGTLCQFQSIRYSVQFFLHCTTNKYFIADILDKCHSIGRLNTISHSFVVENG